MPIGALIAMLGATTGVGGGLFAVPLLHFVYGLALRQAVATSLIFVGVNSAAATLTEWSLPESRLRWDLVAVLVVATLIGAQIGYRVARRISPRRLAQVFAVALFLVGLRLFFSSPSVPDLPFEGSLGASALALAFASGLGGGILAPLLGIGGGLVIVPGLLLFVPQLGFGTVRAASMATAIVSSARSAWLHHADRNVRFREGAWLGLGAALGAVAGVFIAHVEGFEQVGRPLLASILWFVAVRFVLSLRRPPPS